MQSLERRVTALEAALPTEQGSAALMWTGESESACRQRCGIAADEANVLFIQLVSPKELSHAEP